MIEQETITEQEQREKNKDKEIKEGKKSGIVYVLGAKT